MSKPKWSDWIDWHATADSVCPLKDGTLHQVIFSDGDKSFVDGSPETWAWNAEELYITAYRYELPEEPTKADEWKKPTDDWPAHSEPVMGWNPYWQDAGNETGIRECFRNAGGDEWLSAVFQEGDDYYQTGDDRPWLCRAYPEPPKQEGT